MKKTIILGKIIGFGLLIYGVYQLNDCTFSGWEQISKSVDGLLFSYIGIVLLVFIELVNLFKK